jgi:hypothetical protein
VAVAIESVAKFFTGLAGKDAARNAYSPNGRVARILAEGANLLVGRGVHQICTKSVLTPRSTTSELALWRTRYRASPNGTTIEARVVIAPTDNVSATQPQWYLKIDGSATVKRTHDARCAAGTGLDIFAGNWFEDRLPATVTPGVKHTVELWTKNCRILSWSLAEVERDTLTSSTDTMVDWSTLSPAHAISTQDLTSLKNTIEAVRQKMRGCTLCFNVDDPATPIALTTTPTGLWDSTHTVKPTVPTQYRDTFSLAGIPVRGWVIGERTAGTGHGHVTFSAGSGGSGTIDITGALGVYETDGLFNFADQVGDDTIDVSGYEDAATSVNVYAFGCQPLVGT